jgi:PPOX class probable FMN-dependent enzyme
MSRMPDAHAITTQDQLQALYTPPSELVLKKVTDRIDPRTAEFIAASPFCILSTFGPRGPHATPRGDAPGFIDVLDDKTLALPDRRGNNRIDALRDIIDNPAVALLFLVPGAGETLRVAGRARLTADPALCERYTVQGQIPSSVMLIEVEEVFMQCQRAILRSRLWGERARAAGAPTGGQLLEAHTKGLVEAAAYDAETAPRVSATLY